MQIKKNILENYLVWLVLFMGQTERRFHLLFSWPKRKFFCYLFTHEALRSSLS